MLTLTLMLLFRTAIGRNDIRSIVSRAKEDSIFNLIPVAEDAKNIVKAGCARRGGADRAEIQQSKHFVGKQL